MMYGNKPNEHGNLCATLDELHYIFASTTDKSCATFQTTEDAFMQHVLHALLQVAIWHHSHEAKPVLWEPMVGNLMISEIWSQ